MLACRTTGRVVAVLASVMLLVACASSPATQVPAATAPPTATPPSAAPFTPAPAPPPSPSPAPSPRPATHDLVDASVYVHGGGFADFSDPTDCAGAGLAADIHSGVEVVVTDAAGVIVGTGTLSKGVAGKDPVGCRLGIRVDGLPEAPSYLLRVGERVVGLLSFEDMFGRWTFVIP